jgi:hypothetical protein
MVPATITDRRRQVMPNNLKGMLIGMAVLVALVIAGATIATATGGNDPPRKQSSVQNNPGTNAGQPDDAEDRDDVGETETGGREVEARENEVGDDPEDSDRGEREDEVGDDGEDSDRGEVGARENEVGDDREDSDRGERENEADDREDSDRGEVEDEAGDDREDSDRGEREDEADDDREDELGDDRED